MRKVHYSLMAGIVGAAMLTLYASTLTATLTGDGNYTSWTPSTGTTHYTLVDEASCNGNTDYVSTNTVGNRDSYQVSLASIPDGSTITAIDITPCASKNASGGSNSTLNVFYRLNGANSADAGAYALSATTPAGLATTTFSGLSITKASSTAFEIGHVLAAGTKGARVSKLSSVITYNLPSFVITASSGGNGTVSPTGTSSVSLGANKTYIITASSSYQIADVVVDGSSIGATSSYTFVNVSAAHSISASFTVAPINAPSNLTASYVPAGTSSPAYVQLIWNDNSSNEAYFSVERSISGGGSWSVIATSTFWSKTDSTIASGTSYDYRIQAINVATSSPYSNTATIAIP